MTSRPVTLATALQAAESLAGVARWADGRIVDANRAFLRTLELSNESLSADGGPRLAELLDAAELERLYARLAEHGRIAPEPFRLRTAAGTFLDGVLCAERLVAAGDDFVVFLVQEPVETSDGTLSLAEAEHRYRTLVDHSHDGIFLIQHGRLLYINQAFAQMLGYDATELTGGYYLDFVAPEDLDAQTKRRLAREMGNTDTQAYEIRLLHRDSSRRLVAVRAGAIDYNGAPASIGTARDVTEERGQQRRLEEAEDKFRRIFEDSVTGIYQTAPDGGLLEANKALARIFGFDSAQHLMQEIDNVRELYVDPAERQALQAMLDRHGSFAEHEFRGRRRDGATIWLLNRARLTADARGAPQHYEGTLQDITARKAAEQALFTSEAKFRTLVESSHAGIFIVEDGTYTYVNQAFAAMLGYAPEEIVGLSYRALVADDDLPAADERFARRMRGETVPNEYETRLVHKDGLSRVTVSASVGVLEHDGRMLMSGTVHDITERKRMESKLRHLATHDPLTDLPNRTLFSRRLEEHIALAHEDPAHSYAVLFLDLDGFKVINDSLGHAAGDRLLTALSARLYAELSDRATVARHGGDEFTILPTDCQHPSSARRLADKVLELLAEPFELDQRPIFTSGSIGIVIGDAGYTDADAVLRDADTAMYEAKALGKSACVVFDRTMHRAARRRLALETELRLALEREEFELHYQPVVDLQDRRIAAVEALVRWHHPERGLLAPGAFLAVAEDIGVMLRLDWWMLDRACRQLRRWHERFPQRRDLRLSANLGRQHFANPRLARDMETLLTATGVDRRRVQVEMTEDVFRGTAARVSHILPELRALGIGVYVDDFGTGYSSLSSFSEGQFDALKIDRSFIDDLEDNSRHYALVRTILRFAEDLELTAIAEGAERAGQIELLRRAGCRLIQGYYFAPPLPAAEIDELLAADAALPLPEVAAGQGR